MDIGVLEELKDKLNLTQLRKPAVIGVVLILVMVAVMSAGRLLMGTATANDFEVVTSQGDSQAEGAPQGEEDSRQETESSGTMIVHVSGAVVTPGVVAVSKGSRVADAVAAAGGLSSDANPDSVNLARPIEDGEQVRIPSLEETDELLGQGVSTSQETQGTDAVQAAAQSGANLVNINTATAEQLETLSGIGEVTAKKIVEDRTANGSFSRVEDLMRVSGVGEKKFEAIRDLICV